VERGDTGPGRGARGLPGRWRRAYGPRDGAQGAGAGAVNGLEDVEDDDYGQLLRRPGEVPPYQRFRQPGGPRTPQPGRFPPPEGYPGSGLPPDGHPGSGLPPDGYPGSGLPPDGYPGSGLPPDGHPASGLPPNGRTMPGRPYRAPDGRLVPPDVDRPYRPQAPGPVDGTRGRPETTRVRVPGQDPVGGIRGRPGRPLQAPSTPPPRVPGGQQAYGGAPGSRGGFMTSQAPRVIRDVPVPQEPADPAGPAGPVIRQRETAVPDERPLGQKQSVASIAPDGLESFARDLRALRAAAELDYPEMAELSHFTMRTLASAAAGLRLPTLPVAVAFVRACGGDVADWEERWQRLAAKITADAAKKRRSDGGEQQAPPEPADSPAIPEPPNAATAQDPDPDPGEVYVITSAKPRLPGWPAGAEGPGGPREPGRAGGAGGPAATGGPREPGRARGAGGPAATGGPREPGRAGGAGGPAATGGPGAPGGLEGREGYGAVRRW
jgi:hypothetical protein